MATNFPAVDYSQFFTKGVDMRRCVLAVLLLGGGFAAQADAQTCNGTSRGANGQLVVEGDSERRVFTVLGQPTRVVPRENRYGAYAGEDWIYYVDGYNPKTVQVWIQGGRAISVCETLD